uniref:3-hydroxyisobutyryl-CoA hydrolase, mitochondrial n=1 Tax=Ditylenchus dipsaci TaxID=166011 RepID=A0A915DMW8_9BILA
MRITPRLPLTYLRHFSTTPCSMSSSEEVLVSNVNHKKVITLNRPKALNALSLPMIRQLTQELQGIHNGTDPTQMVIVRGSGGKAFCAGGDVLAVTKSYKEGTSVCKDFFREEYQLNYMLGTLQVPYIALMDGITMFKIYTPGCGMSINGRFRVATERTMLAMPETALGLFPDVGATHFLLKGSDVVHSGMATNYTSSQNMEKLVTALLELPKEKCTEQAVQAELEGFELQNEIQKMPDFTLEPHLEIIHRCFSASSVEEVLGKLKKQNTDFANAQLKELHKMSPTSLKVTFKQIKEGPSLNFADVFPIEYRLTQRFLKEHDFHEDAEQFWWTKTEIPNGNRAHSLK